MLFRSIESDENALFTANVIANKTIKIDGKDVDASKITPEFLSGTLQEADGIDTNVATGYHAIEFLLWGQDFDANGPGKRSWNDFVDGQAANADRRRDYLKIIADLLVEDIASVAKAWQANGANYRARHFHARLAHPLQHTDHAVFSWASDCSNAVAKPWGSSSMVACRPGTVSINSDSSAWRAWAARPSVHSAGACMCSCT